MQKKKRTRNQIATEAKNIAAQASATVQMQQVMMNAYRYTVKAYFGADLPQELVVTLESAMRTAIEKAAAERANLNLQPVIDGVVADFKAKESAAPVPA